MKLHRFLFLVADFSESLYQIFFLISHIMKFYSYRIFIILHSNHHFIYLRRHLIPSMRNIF